MTDLRTARRWARATLVAASMVATRAAAQVLWITKAGYEDLNLPVDIGPTAATPLTLLMKRKPEGHDRDQTVDATPRA